MTDGELIYTLVKADLIDQAQEDSETDQVVAPDKDASVPADRVYVPDPDPSIRPGPWYIWGPDPILDGEVLPGDQEPFLRERATLALITEVVSDHWNRYPDRRPESLTFDDVFDTIIKKLVNGGKWSDEDAAGLGEDHRSMVWNRWRRGTRTTWQAFLAKQVLDRYSWTLQHYGYLSVSDRRQVKQLIHVENGLKESLGREPTDGEIAAAYGPQTRLSTIRGYKALREAFQVRCLDEFESSGASLGRSADKVTLDRLASQSIKAVTTSMPKRSGEILWRLLIEGEKPSQVAASLNLQPSRVRQLRREATAKAGSFLKLYDTLTPAQQSRIAASIVTSGAENPGDWSRYERAVTQMTSLSEGRLR
jgi:hypothetical protein